MSAYTKQDRTFSVYTLHKNVQKEDAWLAKRIQQAQRSLAELPEGVRKHAHYEGRMT